MNGKIDGVLLEVIGNTYMSIAEEMGAVLVKSAYSTNIKERRDCSCGVFDINGETIAQAEHIPMHLGSLLGIVRDVLRFYPLEAIREGDMFIANDAYNGGGTHLPDISVASPVFWEGKLIAFVCNIAHHNDVGGRVPGSNAGDSRSIYEEGIRIPPVKIFSEGALNEDILRLILLNCRIADIRCGDLNAQFACNNKGIQRVRESCAHYGADLMLECMREMLAYSERRMRLAIRGLPKGKAAFTDFLDSDGVGGPPIPLHVELEIREDEIFLDFSRNPPQVAGAINLIDPGLRACLYYCLKSIVDPGLPANGGYYRAIRYVAPEGSVVSCKEPAAVAGRTDTAQRVCDLIFGAMARIVPQRVMAGCNSAITSIVFSGREPGTDRTYVYLESVGGGSGARFCADGLDAVQVHMTNTSNLPIECMELEYPLMVERYEMVADSGGPGTYRGGLCIRKDIRIMEGRCTFTVKADRTKTPPWGLDGGGAGSCGSLTLDPDTDHPVVLDSKTSGTRLEPGTRVSCRTPGAGGYGNPHRRERALIVRDLEQGLISAESAVRDYGMAEEAVRAVGTFIRASGEAL